MKFKVINVIFLTIFLSTAYAVESFGNNASILNPITNDLIDFTAVVNGEQVDIEWVTDTELNIDYFVIQRSSDSLNFDDIATIGATGKSSSVLRYSIIDFQPLAEISFYRLKQVDLEGNVKFSDIVPVKIESNKELNPAMPVVLVSPNPVPSSGNMNVLLSNFKNNETVNVVLHNQSGIECSANTLHTDAEGNVVFNFSCADLSPGLYLISAQSNSSKVNTMIVISNK